MISIAVVAHQARIVEATELARSLDAVISVDDGTLRAEGNHLQAWRMTAERESDYALVLEDDAQPVPGFVEQAELALAVAPEPVVSFYTGMTRPKRWQERIAPAIAKADQAGSHWMVSTHVLHAVAVAIHVSLREDWLDFADGSKLPIDERLTAWCLARDHKVAYSWPSLCNHADGPTLVRHANTGNTTGPRKAWRTGSRATWTPQSVPM
ncbi:hypothetical protein [Nocardia sp. NPDC049149]|uniref:hypothetical protein n=1 Tax=Nocardia sp. NPDC049149 TaxID=3364315 RepID=UPI0037178071